jgi:hypothetical protein
MFFVQLRIAMMPRHHFAHSLTLMKLNEPLLNPNTPFWKVLNEEQGHIVRCLRSKPSSLTIIGHTYLNVRKWANVADRDGPHHQRRSQTQESQPQPVRVVAQVRPDGSVPTRKESAIRQFSVLVGKAAEMGMVRVIVGISRGRG